MLVEGDGRNSVIGGRSSVVGSRLWEWGDAKHIQLFRANRRTHGQTEVLVEVVPT